MKKTEISFTRERLFSGFDGKTCKVAPSLTYDGENTMLLNYEMLLLSGSDVFFDKYIAKSTDGGKTFEKPIIQKTIPDKWQDNIRIRHDGYLQYNKKHKKWFGVGFTTTYANDNYPIGADGGMFYGPSRMPLYYSVDGETGELMNCVELPFPFEYGEVIPFGQVELDNGDMLLAFYFSTRENFLKTKIVTVRYTMEEENLRIVAHGEPVVFEAGRRGCCEPDITYWNGKYYMTVRSDEMGMYAESEDGLHYSELKPWMWDDGSILENYNTQQHWVRNEKGLFLVYTRCTQHNSHVFRNRAPLFMTRFDEKRKCLIKDEEVILVPELGARLGNFTVLEVSEKESWVVVAEWMQSDDPEGCAKYGSDNSIWIAKVYSK